jgi:hypothetical protein
MIVPKMGLGAGSITAAREARIERIRARQRRLLTLAPWFCGAVPTLAIVWSVHVWSTLHRDPFGLGFDFALFAASSLLRVVAFLGLGLLLVRVHAVLFRNPRRAIVAAATWGALGTLAVLLLAASRGWWALRISDDAVKYYSSMPARYFEPGRAEWLGPWKHGLVTTCEVVLTIGLACLNAAIGYILGDKPRGSMPIAIGGSWALLVVYLCFLPWFHFDFDNFHGDIFSGAVTFDMAFPIASDPYTTLAIPFYVAAWLGNLLILRGPPVPNAVGCQDRVQRATTAAGARAPERDRRAPGATAVDPVSLSMLGADTGSGSGLGITRPPRSCRSPCWHPWPDGLPRACRMRTSVRAATSAGPLRPSEHIATARPR